MSDPPESKPAKEPRTANAAPFVTSCFVMLVALVAIELCYRDSPIDPQIRKGQNISAKAIDYATMSADIVTTGNSTMYHAIKPSAIEETLRTLKGQTYTTYNYGVPSAGPPVYLMVATQAVHHKPPPRLFIIGVTPILSICCGDLIDAQGPLGMSPAAIPPIVLASWRTSPEDAGWAPFAGLSHLIGGRGEILAAMRDLKLPPPYVFTERGYYSLGGPVEPGAQNVRAKGRAQSYADGMDKSKGAKLHVTGQRYLAEAIRVLQAADVKVVLIGVPQARQLDWYQDDKHTYPEYLAEMDDFSRRFGVEFVNMYAPPVLTNGHFVDGDHMTDIGATTFSKYLAETVIARYLP